MSPKEEIIKKLTFLLEEKRRKERRVEKKQKYEKVKDILIFLAFFGACIFAPKAMAAFKPLLPKPKYNSWKKFNKRHLRWTLNRLAREKIVHIEDRDGEKILTITQKGHNRIIKYALDELEIPIPEKWDGKWRLVIYDISKNKCRLAQILRKYLERCGFMCLQESVYLFPYPCTREIEFLRSYYGLDKEIKLIVASLIEDEEVYKNYFDLK